VGYLQQILQLPYAPWWIPGVIFLVVVVGIYWVLRRTPVTANWRPEDSATSEAGTVALTMAEPLNKRPPELRQSSRRQGNPIEVFVAGSEDKKVLEQAYVLDRSLGGLRIATIQELPVGTILSIRPVQAIEIVPWVDLEVRSCRPRHEIPGEFDLGCQFVKLPPYPVMLLFG
jgi:hypothetical protein